MASASPAPLAMAPAPPKPLASQPASRSASRETSIAPAPVAIAASPVTPIAPAPLPTPPANAPVGTGIVMTKQWVVPPLPKPGRKPATDTPPTRKAQNRAAQRAFRERRAARVNELEDEISKLKAESEKEKEERQSEIARLILEKSQLLKKLETLTAENSRLQLQNQRRASEPVSAASPASTSADSGIALSMSSGSPPAEPRKSCSSLTSTTTTCARASDGSCPCKKRPSSPNLEPVRRPPSPMETDFTNIFRSRKRAASPPPTSIQISDPCGFCQDGSPCFCAELARSGANAPEYSPYTLENITERDLENPILPPLRSLGPISSECDGSGNCGTCRKDPLATLFCRTLVASSTSAPESTASSDFPEIKVREDSPMPLDLGSIPTTLERESAVYIPAEAAYQALSRHERFSSERVDKIVRPLEVRWNATGGVSVEAESVKRVIRELDRGFGRW